MKYKGYIYCYTSPSGKQYIGQTTHTPQERAGTNGKGYKGQMFYEAIKKYGFENITLEILHIFEFQDKKLLVDKLNQFEEKEIRKRNTIFPFGYNMTYGGENSLMSDELKNKIRQTKIKQNSNHEYRKMISLKTKEAMAKPEIKKKNKENTKKAMWRPEVRLKYLKNFYQSSEKGKQKAREFYEHRKMIGIKQTKHGIRSFNYFYVCWCKECFRYFETNDEDRQFCSKSCSSKYTQRTFHPNKGIKRPYRKRKPHSQETKEKIRQKAIEQWKRQKNISS